MRFLGRIGVIDETWMDNGELSVDWEIGDFSSMSKQGGDYYESPDFRFSNALWCLLMYSSGMIGHEPSRWVGLFLEKKSSPIDDSYPPMDIQFTLSIKGTDGIKMREELKHRFSNHKFGTSAFFSREKLEDYKELLMPNGQLTISCSMIKIVPNYDGDISSYQAYQPYDEFRESSDGDDYDGNSSLNKQSDNSIPFCQNSLCSQSLLVAETPDKLNMEPQSSLCFFKDASSQTDEKCSRVHALNQESHCLEKQGLEKVVEDISKLLVSSDNYDVTVQVSDIQFKVHKAILSARSPVLSAMFRNETLEKSLNKITIYDCEPDIFEEFLHYIYSGSVQLLNKQNVFGLYSIADRYLADDLKQQCLKLILDILCVQTFCNTVKLALTHGECDLLKLTTDFASTNISLILCSVEWQNFIREYPAEANEILIKCFGPHSKHQS